MSGSRGIAVASTLFVAALGAGPGHAPSADTTAPRPLQHGAQPNPQEVRPGSAEGDQPSASAGRLIREDRARRILGLPVGTAILLGAILLVLVVVGGVLGLGARRRPEPRQPDVRDREGPRPGGRSDLGRKTETVERSQDPLDIP